MPVNQSYIKDRSVWQRFNRWSDGLVQIEDFWLWLICGAVGALICFAFLLFGLGSDPNICPTYTTKIYIYQPCGKTQCLRFLGCLQNG